MLSLTRKSEDQAETGLRWHVDFRSAERLPDTKVVRTTFFINTAAIAVALLLLSWAGWREYHIRTLTQQIADAQQQIDSNVKQSNEALRLSKIFAGEEKKLAEAINFQHIPITISAFIKILGQTLPREVSIESFDARLSDSRNRVFVVRGLVAGTRDQASGSASSYLEALRAQPQFKAVFESISVDRLNPDGNSGLLGFDISLKIKPEEKK